MLETERLIIKPLNYSQLLKYIKCDSSLEEELQLLNNARTISAELKEALEQTILINVENHPQTYLFHTLWTAISKSENKMVGDLCIVGEPNEEGEVEIGYGTYDEFQNKGYMTETVGAVISWLNTHDKVKAIIASTEKANTASFKVLEKNHFIKIGETETQFNWCLRKELIS